MKDLKEYKKKFGDCNVSSRNTDDKSLAGWVANMRNARKGKVTSKLTGEMIDSLKMALASIGARVSLLSYLMPRK